jgi:hypothetical protein
MNKEPFITKNGYVVVVKRVAQTETKPTIEEITCRIGNSRSSHWYNEDLFNFLVRKLKESEEPRNVQLQNSI